MLEIERKWILTHPVILIPDDKVLAKIWYFGNGDTRIMERYFMDDVIEYRYSSKGDGSLTRTEFEEVLSREEFETMLMNVPAQFRDRPIVRITNRYNDGDDDVVIYTIISEDKPVTYVEREFTSVDEANEYILPPPYIQATEVTYDASHKMKNIWKRIRA